MLKLVALLLIHTKALVLILWYGYHRRYVVSFWWFLVVLLRPSLVLV